MSEATTEAAPKKADKAPSKRTQKAAQKASDAVQDAILRGDLKAAKKIGSTFFELREVRDKLKEEGKRLRDQVSAKEALLSGAIEQDVDPNDVQAVTDKLEAIVDAYQEVKEAEAEKKDQLGILRSEKKELEGRLEKQVEGARQLGLFDD